VLSDDIWLSIDQRGQALEEGVEFKLAYNSGR